MYEQAHTAPPPPVSHSKDALSPIIESVISCRYVRVYDKLQLQPEYEINPNELELMEKVGEGEFGSVHKGRWNKTTVAIKVLRRSDAVALGDFRCFLLAIPPPPCPLPKLPHPLVAPRSSVKSGS